MLVNDKALGEATGDLGLMRCGGIGCLEQQPGRATEDCLEWPENIGISSNVGQFPAARLVRC